MTRPLFALAAIAAVLAAPAAATAAEPTKRSLDFDVTVGPNNDTPCKITANLFTPPGVSKSNPAPAVMGTNGFGGSKADFDTLGLSYARRGYVFLAYSGLGFGNSGCKITLDDPDWDGKGGSQLLSFLGGTKAAKDGTKIDYVVKDGPGDPRVGMIGGSYGGQIQFAIAGIDPRLDALVPQITWNDLAYSLGPNNTDFLRGVTYRTPGVTKSDWPVLFTALGLGQGFQQAVQNNDPSHLGACPNFTDQVCISLVTTGATGYPDEATLALLRHASVASYISRIRIPTLLAQGQSDTLFDLQESVATYQALRAQGTPVKMLWRSSGHSGGGIPGESSAGNPESAYESRMALEWFDFYLKGIGDAPVLDFSFLRNWVTYTGDAVAAVGATTSYPAGFDQTMYLSGSDRLVSDRSGIQAGTASFAAAPNASGSGNGYTQTPGLDPPGTAATYNTPPLTGDFDLVGIPKLTVRLDAPTFAQSQGQNPAGKLVLFAKLLDVDPSGNATLPRNLLSAVRVADVTKPVEIELPGVAHRFAKGHVMRLVIATSNATNRGNTAAGPVSIAANPASPNTLTLPKLGRQIGTTRSGFALFESPGGASQPPGKGAKPRGLRAATMSTNRRCVRGRSIRVRVIRRSGRLRGVRAQIFVNGRRIKTVTGQRKLRRFIKVTGLPRRGVYRVLVTVRTSGGQVLGAARTYRAC